MPSQNISNYLNRVSLIICSLLVLSGQSSINTLLRNNEYLYDIKISTVLIIALILIIGIFYKKIWANNIKINIYIIIILTSIIIFFNIIISLFEKRIISVSLNQDIITIAFTCIFMLVLIKTKKDFLFFMQAIVIGSLVLLFLNYFLWGFNRIILFSQLSSNRMALFGLGAATLLFINNSKFVNFLLIFLLTFLISSGSLKMGFLAYISFIFIAISMLIIYQKYKIAQLIFLNAALSLSFGYFNKNFEDIESRLIVNFKEQYNIPTDVNKTTTQLSEIDKYLDAQCKKSINYEYCISDKYTFNDKTERIRMWAHAISLIQSNPFFGLGEGGYSLRLAYRYSSGNNVHDYTYPHNIFLNLAVEFGLPFTLFMAIIIISCFLTAIRSSIYKPEIIGLVAAGAAIFIASNTGGDLYDARYIFYMTVLAGLYTRTLDYQTLRTMLEIRS
jgi:hypothetical protein